MFCAETGKVISRRPPTFCQGLPFPQAPRRLHFILFNTSHSKAVPSSHHPNSSDVFRSSACCWSRIMWCCMPLGSAPTAVEINSNCTQTWLGFADTPYSGHYGRQLETLDIT